MTTHALDHHHATVRIRGAAQAVHRAGRDLDRREEPEREVGGCEIVVDRLRHADHWHAVLAVQTLSRAERALPADRDQRVEPMLAQGLEHLRHQHGGVVLGVVIRIVPAAAEQRPALDQQQLEVDVEQRARPIRNQAAPAVAKADELDIGGEQSPGQTADRGVEPRGIAAARQHPDPHRRRGHQRGAK